MKVYYALYDQSYDNYAQYWTWYPEELTRQMRDAIASKAGAFQMRPKHPNGLQNSDVDGGIINLQDEWCVVYRFFNGGNDPQGRPDRCVLATAWVKVSEAQGQNIYDLLFSPVFQDIQRLAPSQCPIDSPEKLVQEYSNPVNDDKSLQKQLKKNLDYRKWRYNTVEETELIGILFPGLISDGIQSLQILDCTTPMETFSGVPLKSGVTATPLIEEEPESEEQTDSPKTKTEETGTPLSFLHLIIATVLALLIFVAVIRIFPVVVPLKEMLKKMIPQQHQQQNNNSPEMNPTDEKKPTDKEEAKTGPAEAGPAKTGPAKAGPAKTGPAKTGPAKTGPAKTGPAEAGPVEAEPAKTGPAKTGPAEAGPAETEQTEKDNEYFDPVEGVKEGLPEKPAEVPDVVNEEKTMPESKQSAVENSMSETELKSETKPTINTKPIPEENPETEDSTSITPVPATTPEQVQPQGENVTPNPEAVEHTGL